MTNFSMSTIVAICCLIFTSTLLLTLLLHRYAINRGMLDVPNNRSSHVEPVPRGGGLSMAIVTVATATFLSFSEVLSSRLAAALIGGGLLVMIVGWIDDHRHVAVRWRILMHFTAAAWTVYWLDGFPSIDIGYMVLPLGWAGHFLAIVGIVWMINLYNFMDGLDGLAAGEAVTVALVAAGLLWWKGAADIALLTLLLAAACGGFLWWNWQPAKIFMGDVGSGFLGYCFAVLMLASEKAGAVQVMVWIILLADFVLDATFTLLGRVIRGEKWNTAHRTHAYQRLTQMEFSHAWVASGVLLTNLFLLAPIAWLVVRQPAWMYFALPGITLVGWFIWRAIQQRFGKTQSIYDISLYEILHSARRRRFPLSV